MMSATVASSVSEQFFFTIAVAHLGRWRYGANDQRLVLAIKTVL
jgi:hypothetical protein